MLRKSFPFLLISLVLLTSCKFSCSVGDKGNEPATTETKDGVRTSNNIELEANGVEVEKAYLLFEDGTAVPKDNVVDFSQPVRLFLVINKGWKEADGKVKLGASEKIEVESGEVLLDEKDLFAKYSEDGISAKDARYITLTAKVTLIKTITPLTAFNVSFRVWDKAGEGYIQGMYKLYSK